MIMISLQTTLADKCNCYELFSQFYLEWYIFILELELMIHKSKDETH